MNLTLLNIATDLARCNDIDVPQDDIRHAARTADAFSVYRTYGTADGLTAPGCRAVEPRCCQRRRTEPALSLLVRILTGDLTPAAAMRPHQFRTRFQQLTGPLMAKSVEDALFFRHNLELALNEVRADLPARVLVIPLSCEMRIRLARQPDALLGPPRTTPESGEDSAGAPLHLTEAPEQWG